MKCYNKCCVCSDGSSLYVCVEEQLATCNTKRHVAHYLVGMLLNNVDGFFC